MSWTEERIETLRKLWTSGMTASQIAEELGGVSRNAVIGKAHRLGLQSRPSPVKSNADTAGEGRAAAPAVPKSVPVRSAAKPAAAAPAAVTPAAPAATTTAATPPSDAPVIRSIGPGGFQRALPSDQQPPIPPAPPRRLVPAKPSPEMANKTSLLDLSDRVCKWPIGHPGEPDFHFCGKPVNPGFPYCLDHCSVAYQVQVPRKDRRPPPNFGLPRPR
jgi:GcrA cell cycle regulator